MNTLTEQFIKEHASDNLDRLLLNASKYQGVDVAWAVHQIDARRKMSAKLPLWANNPKLHFPVRLSMEQCSSEQTARYKASLCSGDTMADLTGGFGVDCFFVGQQFRKVFYVEQNAELCALARHNFSVLKFLHTEILEVAAETFLAQMGVVDMIFLDPARRDALGRKVVALTNCTPDITALLPLLKQKSKYLLLKLSPMLDIASVLHQMPWVSEVHIVAVDGECKELLFLIRWNEQCETRFFAVDLQKNNRQQSFSFTLSEEQNAVCEYANEVGTYLYEPDVAILKSGAFRLFAQRFGLKKLHQNTHLYTSDTLVESSPSRIFVVENQAGFSKKSLNKILSNMKSANISIRNFPESVDVLRRRLKLKDGGDDFLFACTNFNNEKILIKCKRYVPMG